MHTPALHVCPDGHALSQAPQWAALLLVSTHSPAQAVRRGVQWQVRSEHVPPVQVVSHEPQCS